MKITDIESIGVFNGFRNFLFVVVHTDEGVTGIGESGLSGRELAVQGVIEHFKPLLIGQDPMRTEHLWQGLFRGAFFPAQRVQGSAISAIDIALWDIKGKALGVPVHQLLGGLTRDKVLCYPHAGDSADTNKLVASCLRLKEEGWKCLRWGVPIDGLISEPRRSMRMAIAQFEAIRLAVGEEMELILDVHTRFDLPEAMRLCREVEKYDPMFIEDPLRCENPDQYRTLRPHVHVPLAAGEQFSSKWEFRQLIEEELIDYNRLDPCLCGGITESKKIAGWSEVHHIKLAAHNPIGPVASAACLHLNLSCPNMLVQEQPARPGTVLKDVFPKQIDWADGHLLPTTAPGLGVEFDIAAARKHPFRPWEPPQTRRLDGSVTNW